MFGIPSIYAYIAGGVAVLGLIGTLHYQSNEIHKYHTEYNCVSYSSDCGKNSKVITVPSLQAIISGMTSTQNKQATVTDTAVEKVVQGPTVIKTVIKEVHDTPNPVACTTPDFPQDVKDSY